MTKHSMYCTESL